MVQDQVKQHAFVGESGKHCSINKCRNKDPTDGSAVPRMNAGDSTTIRGFALPSVGLTFPWSTAATRLLAPAKGRDQSGRGQELIERPLASGF